MASTYRVLIASIFFLFFFSCSNTDKQESDPALEVMLLECKPIEWPDGSTSYSIYATIGTNQTKVANAPACQSVETVQIGEYSSEREIVSMLDCSQGDSLLYYFMEKTDDGLTVGYTSGNGENPKVITTYRNGKFFFQ